MPFPSPPLRAPIHLDIDQALVDRMVDRFYAMVRTHVVLGPIFLREVEDWPRHLDRMQDFLSSVISMTEDQKSFLRSRCRGQPSTSRRTSGPQPACVLTLA